MEALQLGLDHLSLRKSELRTTGTDYKGVFHSGRLSGFISMSLCNLCVLRVSVVSNLSKTFTTETQRTPRLHRDLFFESENISPGLNRLGVATFISNMTHQRMRDFVYRCHQQG